jgi:diguanylate cyclase (GGDEF)-like protein
MEKRIRLIIIDDDFNDSEKMISLVKSAGFGVRSEKAEDEEDLNELLASHDPELILCTIDGMPELSLEQTIACVQAGNKSVPVIAIDNDGSKSTVECMVAGAADKVNKADQEHLKQVVLRTALNQFEHEELIKARESLKEAEVRCKTLLNSSKDAIAYVHDGMHIYANDSYLELFGYESWDDLEGMPILDLVGSDDQSKFKEFLRAYDKSSDPNQDLDLKLTPLEEEVFEANMEFSQASIDGEHCTQVIIRSRENSKELQEQIDYLSQRDLLTGLYNRPTFMTRLTEALEQAHGGEGNSVVMHLELDNFDSIRQELGINAGDKLLTEAGKLFMEKIGDENMIARFEGDSFTILSPHFEGAALDALTNTLLTGVADHSFDLDGKSVSCTASIGATIIDEEAPDDNEVISRANKAFEEATGAGGNKVVIYKPKAGEMTQKQVDTEWANKIKAALTSDRLKLLYQPVVSLHGDPGERYEVFVRLIDEQGEAVSPAEFMESAERSGIASALDRWVTLNAIRALQERRKAGKQAIFFIKLTAGSLQDESIPGWIKDQITQHQVPPECFVFELKEKTAVSYLNQAKNLVKILHEIEAEFTLDGFGSGENPFQILTHLPADYLKIDGHFMENLAGSPENQSTIKGLTDKAHTLSKLTIAQRVDDANALSVLWGMGVNFIQGNFLCPPSETADYDFSSMGG